MAELSHFIFPLLRPAIASEFLGPVSQAVKNGGFVAAMPNYWLHATGRDYFAGRSRDGSAARTVGLTVEVFRRTKDWLARMLARERVRRAFADAALTTRAWYAAAGRDSTLK